MDFMDHNLTIGGPSLKELEMALFFKTELSNKTCQLHDIYSIIQYCLWLYDIAAALYTSSGYIVARVLIWVSPK